MSVSTILSQEAKKKIERKWRKADGAIAHHYAKKFEFKYVVS
jgi:hypothetical protein